MQNQYIIMGVDGYYTIKPTYEDNIYKSTAVLYLQTLKE